MLCENCKGKIANVRYTQIINGVKKEMHLCEKCAEKLGINTMSFSMPMSFNSVFDDLFEEDLFIRDFSRQNLFGNIFDDNFSLIIPEKTEIIEKEDNVFEDEMDYLVKKLNKERKEKNSNKNELKIAKLQKRLEKEIKEERYEDAAKTRDEIKKMNLN